MKQTKPATWKPAGILLRFDTWKAAQDLSDEDFGALVRAAMDFAETGVETEFDDERLEKLWPPIRDELLARNRKLEESGVGAYLAYRSTVKEHGEAPMSFGAWKRSGRPADNPFGRIPR